MKSTTTYLILLGLALASMPLKSRGQANANPPGQLSYQGFLTDANGIPLATNTPVNFTIQFRIYDASAGGNLLWGEQQIVTVDRGYFTVLLGNGISIGAPGSGDLSSVFSGPTASDRYLGMTVQGLSGNEIAPRLRFNSSPYAFLARNATGLIGPDGSNFVSIANGVLTINGSVNATSFNSIDGEDFASLSDTAPQIFHGQVVFPSALVRGSNPAWSLVNGVNNSNAGDLGLATGPAAYSTSALNNDIVLRANAGNLLLQNGAGAAAMAIHNNHVGIGTTTPGADLHVVGSVSRSQVVIESASNIGTWLHLKNTSAGGQDWSIWSSGTANSEGTGNLLFTDSQTRMIIANGNVGIGTLTPQSKLDVSGDVNVSGNANISGTVVSSGGIASIAHTSTHVQGAYLEWNKDGATGKSYLLNQKGFGNGGIIFGEVDTNNAITERMRIDWTGNVGIGTTNPAAPLDVEIMSGGNSIKAVGNVQAPSYLTFSDRRIKDIIGQTDTRKDLRQIETLHVTDYRMKDNAAQGNTLHKGFIAQEVQEVIPEAVNEAQGFIPNICAVAERLQFDPATQTLRVSMAKAHELKKGDLVRLSTDEVTSEHEVSDVPDEKTFVIGAIPAEPARAFVFGKRVDDFLSVDYNCVFTTGIGAIQELAKRVATLESRASHVAELKQKAARVDTLEREVADLKKVVAQLAESGKSKQTVLAIPLKPDSTTVAAALPVIVTAGLNH